MQVDFVRAVSEAWWATCHFGVDMKPQYGGWRSNSVTRSQVQSLSRQKTAGKQAHLLSIGVFEQQSVEEENHPNLHQGHYVFAGVSLLLFEIDF